MILKYTIILIILFINFKYYDFLTINKYNNFIKKDIYSKLFDIFKKDFKTPIILDGCKTHLKKDFCKIFCEINNISFKEYTFNSFLLTKPHLLYEYNMLYINDYLIGNGRILNDIENETLRSIPKNNNIIIFESINIDTIPYKDSHINQLFNIIKFPSITKKEIVYYINDIINEYNYDDNLFLLNWLSYDIEELNLEKINMLLFELDLMIKDNNLTIKEIHHMINHIINGLKNDF
jgi:hypothetical protein